MTAANRISPATPEDVPAVKTLLEVTWWVTYRGVLPDVVIHEATTVWHASERLQAQIEDDTVWFGVAKTENGVVVGMATITREDAATLFVGRLYVHPDHQGQGTGTRLLAAGLEHFSGARVVRLDVEKGNRAAYDYYLRRGFGKVDEIAVQVAGVRVEAFIMAARLPLTSLSAR